MRHYRLIDQNPIKTKRLLLTPMSDAELAERITDAPDERLRDRYADRRRRVAAYYDQALWHTGWRITLRETKKTVGYLGFQGEPRDKTVEIGYDLPEESRGDSYASEATKALCDWAFLKENVYFVRVAADPEQEPSAESLRNLKFYRIEHSPNERDTWELERPASVWTAVYLCIGLAIGLALGSSFFGSQTLGMVIGMSAGLALGVTMDSQDRAARKREHEPKQLDSETKKAKKK